MYVCSTDVAVYQLIFALLQCEITLRLTVCVNYSCWLYLKFTVMVWVRSKSFALWLSAFVLSTLLMVSVLSLMDVDSSLLTTISGVTAAVASQLEPFADQVVSSTLTIAAGIV